MLRAWPVGEVVVSLTEIEMTEGKADFVGEDGFGHVELEMHMVNPTSAIL